MSSIARRPDGSWRACYRDPSGREHSSTTHGKGDAQRWLDEATAGLVTSQIQSAEQRRPRRDDAAI